MSRPRQAALLSFGSLGFGSLGFASIAFALLSSASLLVGLSGCYQGTTRTTSVCPPPPVPICAPGTFAQTLYDTTRPAVGRFYHHIELLPEPVNSNVDDNAIAFIPSGSGKLFAIVSSDRRVSVDEPAHTVQRMFSAPFKTTTRFGSVLRLEEEASPAPLGAGFYCIKDGRYYYTAKAENPDPDDYDIFSAVVEIDHDTLRLSHVERVPVINKPTFFDGQPALTPDGLTIYFTSDRSGGVGGTDLWYATRPTVTGSSWSEPKDVGPPINTECDEISPMVAPNGKTLYFASNGHATIGGYDLFRCVAYSAIEQGGGGWGLPENLGASINTKYDEVFPYALNDTAFFFESNQPASLGGRNLYALTRTYLPLKMGEPVVADTQTAAAASVDSVREALKHTPVRVVGHVEQGHRRDSTELFVQDPETHTELANRILVPSGDFQLLLNRGKQYDVGVRNEESFYDVKRLDLRTTLDTLMYVHLSLPDTLVLHINFPFDDYQNPYEFIIGDSGEQLNVTWEHSLDMVAQSAISSMPKLKSLELIGHTDSLGTDAYNDLLGQHRAEFVKAELIKRGVPASIIRIESRGRRQPVDRRSFETDDIFRLRCRRVEFVKVFKH